MPTGRFLPLETSSTVALVKSTFNTEALSNTTHLLSWSPGTGIQRGPNTGSLYRHSFREFKSVNINHINIAIAGDSGYSLVNLCT